MGARGGDASPKNNKTKRDQVRTVFPTRYFNGELPAQFSQYVNIKPGKSTEFSASVLELRKEARKDELTAATHTKPDLFTGPLPTLSDLYPNATKTAKSRIDYHGGQ